MTYNLKENRVELLLLDFVLFSLARDFELEKKIEKYIHILKVCSSK